MQCKPQNIPRVKIITHKNVINGDIPYDIRSTEEKWRNLKSRLILLNQQIARHTKRESNKPRKQQISSPSSKTQSLRHNSERTHRHACCSGKPPCATQISHIFKLDPNLKKVRPIIPFIVSELSEILSSY